MRVFIDARDIINMFNESRPITVGAFGQRLRDGGHELVIPWSLISELVPSDNNLIVIARRFVTIEDDVPHVFLQQHELDESEIHMAAEDFIRQRPAQAYDPYRENFQDLWGDRFDAIFLMDVGRTVGFRKMAKQVELLAEHRPSVLHWSDAESAQAVQILKNEQTAITSEKPKVAFENAVARWVKRSAAPLIDRQVPSFATFLRRNPRIAPGWRLFMDVFDHIARDKAYHPTRNDLWDFANITMLPYVDLATLDKNKVDLVKRATRTMQQYDRTVNYASRVVSNINDLLQRL